MLLLLAAILAAILWPDLVAGIIGWILALAVYALIALTIFAVFFA